MDYFLIGLGVLFLTLGIIGCIVPGLPGPPLSYIAILLLQFTSGVDFTWEFLLLWALITIAVSVLDYVIPAFGAKKFGSSRWGMVGSIVGLIIGTIFFGPIGMLLGIFGGAILGEIIAGKNTDTAFKAGIGSFVGFVFGSVLKLAVSGFMSYYFVQELIST